MENTPICLSDMLDAFRFRNIETGVALSLRDHKLSPIGWTLQGPCFSVPDDCEPVVRGGPQNDWLPPLERGYHYQRSRNVR